MGSACWTDSWDLQPRARSVMQVPWCLLAACSRGTRNGARRHVDVCDGTSNTRGVSLYGTPSWAAPICPKTVYCMHNKFWLGSHLARTTLALQQINKPASTCSNDVLWKLQSGRNWFPPEILDSEHVHSCAHQTQNSLATTSDFADKHSNMGPGQCFLPSMPTNYHELTLRATVFSLVHGALRFRECIIFWIAIILSDCNATGR